MTWSCASRAEFTALEAEQQVVIDLYGPAFKKEYGWAAEYIGNVDPKFSQLEDAADRDLDAAQAYYNNIKARAAAFRRDPDQLHVLPAARPVVGRTAEEAEAKYQELIELVSIDNALSSLARPFNEYDFTQHDLDGPFPLEAAEFGANSNQSAVNRIVEAVKAEGLTLRQTALRFATPRGHFVGSPEQVADSLQQWFEARGADGFVLFCH